LIANDVKGKQKLYEVNMQSSSLPPPPPQADVVGWTKQPKNHIKINVDASFIAGTGLAGLGAVGRDCFGDIVFSVASYFHGCSDAEEAEVQVLSFGLNQDRKLNLNKVQMKTDCITVMAAVNDCNVSRGSSWACYDNSKDIKEVGVCSVSKVHRESNVVAHELAAHARVNGDFFVLVDVPQA
uniref:RNase H type-1 domain-containing protein n=1 Tax=Aegilops tauschii subsp. strangulata TaxID=200361 RepID=A0A453GKZ1_AEGTS